MSNLNLRFFDISWLSRYDGPGYRVVLYLQGCHLRCTWCHSPHSQSIKPQLLTYPERCQHCGSCVQVCTQGVHQVTADTHQVYRERCIGCGKCIDACPVSHRNQLSGALVQPMKTTTVAELWELLLPQLDIVRSIGGLTVSGGEALLQSEALAGLLRLCKDENIHTTIETSGALPEKHIKDVVSVTDCWLYGLRPTPLYIPPHAEKITENLSLLVKTGSRIIIRTPIIAGVTDQPDSLERIASIMQANGLLEIQLLPFNRETSHYYRALGRECQVGNEAIVTSERMKEVCDFFLKKSFLATIIQ